ncbi:hypothetical protein CDAR_401151 [Caerostris darwini]|uniref:Uncharacterized protein n=1 Tax=Caerostris darwini TaxID=1538125 RepID=A0AAV4T6F9_9ARAC|nr:hypothetical protein CDAR_401151 [Caerostris darwini]
MIIQIFLFYKFVSLLGLTFSTSILYDDRMWVVSPSMDPLSKTASIASTTFRLQWMLHLKQPQSPSLDPSSKTTSIISTICRPQWMLHLKRPQSPQRYFAFTGLFI